VSFHGDAALKALRSIKGRRTNTVKATVALTHATLDVADAIRAQIRESVREWDLFVALWNEDKP
jgi:hypothetical protein